MGIIPTDTSYMGAQERGCDHHALSVNQTQTEIGNAWTWGRFSVNVICYFVLILSLSLF